MTYLLALALGALYCIGFAPFDFWLSTAVAIGGLFWLLHVSHAKPWLTAFCFGVGKYAVGASWVYVSIHVYGNAPPVLAGLLVAVFVATLSLLFVLPLGWLYSRLRPVVPWAQMDVFVFVAVWGLLDWFSTWAFTGFPWLLPGYAFMQAGTQGLAPLVGCAWFRCVLGLSFCGIFGFSAVPQSAARAVDPVVSWYCDRLRISQLGRCWASKIRGFGAGQYRPADKVVAERGIAQRSKASAAVG